jgi:hypothetical protein
MNKAECAKVLAKIQLGDNRQVDALTLEEWFDTIGHLDYEHAIGAVRIHRQESTDWIMPAHVIKNARRVRDRLEREARLSRPALPRGEITLDREKFDAETRAAYEQWRIGREMLGP